VLNKSEGGSIVNGRVCAAPEFAFPGKFYAAATVLDDFDQQQVQYLHRDGTWHLSCFVGKVCSGYFDSEAEATAALERSEPPVWLHS